MEGERITAGQLVSRWDSGHFITLIKALYLKSIGLAILRLEASFEHLGHGHGDPNRGQGDEETSLSIYEASSPCSSRSFSKPCAMP